MSKIIINIPDDSIDLNQAVECVRQVISEGRVSQTTKGVKHFCWLTQFRNGLVVSTHTKKKNQTSDSFVVLRGK